MRKCLGMVVVAVLSWVSSVRASDVDLQWSAPSACPSEANLREGLDSRVGRRITFGPDAGLHVSARITHQGDGYALALQTRSDSGSEARLLRAHSCNELARASVLIVALLLTRGAPAPSTPAREPEAARESARDLEPASTGPRSWRWRTRVYGVADVGTLPGVSFGPGLGLGLALHSTQFELGALYLPTQDVSQDMVSPMMALTTAKLAKLQLVTATAGVCQLVVQKPEIGPCLGAELGRLLARGIDPTAQNFSSGVTWLLFTLSARVSLRINAWLLWHAEILAGLPWDRTIFAVMRDGSSETLHEIPSLIGRLSTGFEARF